MAKLYRRLPGRGVQLYGVKRLYAGPDHILQIMVAAGSEEYKRFYFTDVQAFIVRRTSGYIWWSIVWGGSAGIWLLWALSIRNTSGWTFFETTFMMIAAFFAFLLVVHLGLGPTCSLVLQTAVHKERLTSVTRARSARKMLAYLTPILAKAQTIPEVAGPTMGQSAAPAASPVPSQQYSEEP